MNTEDKSPGVRADLGTNGKEMESSWRGTMGKMVDGGRQLDKQHRRDQDCQLYMSSEAPESDAHWQVWALQHWGDQGKDVAWRCRKGEDSCSSPGRKGETTGEARTPGLTDCGVRMDF